MLNGTYQLGSGFEMFDEQIDIVLSVPIKLYSLYKPIFKPRLFVGI